jgi:hypothetical protein
MHSIARRGTAVLKGALVVALLAMVLLWPGWRAELQAQNYDGQNYDGNECTRCYREFKDDITECPNELGELYPCFIDRSAELAACLLGCGQ